MNLIPFVSRAPLLFVIDTRNRFIANNSRAVDNLQHISQTILGSNLIRMSTSLSLTRKELMRSHQSSSLASTGSAPSSTVNSLSYHTAASHASSASSLAAAASSSSSSSASPSSAASILYTESESTRTDISKTKEDHVVARIVPNQYKDYEVQKPQQFRVDSAMYRSILYSSTSCHKNKNIVLLSKDENNNDDDDDEFVTTKLTNIIDTKRNNYCASNLSVVLDLNINVTVPINSNSTCDDETSKKTSNCATTSSCAYTTKSIHLHMNRNSNESASRTLERLDISTKKKLDRLFKNTSKKNKRRKTKDYKSTNHVSQDTCSCCQNTSGTSTGIICTGTCTDTCTGSCTGTGTGTGTGTDINHSSQHNLLKNNKNQNVTFLFQETNNDSQTMEHINIESLTALQLIQNLSSIYMSSNGENRHSQYRISIPSMATTCTQRQQHPTKQGIKFICNPPTILSIQTPFENFLHNIYVGVPITIQTSLLHATKVIVSWFANDQLVKYDSLFFIPTEDHIEAVITVLLQPINTNTCSHGQSETDTMTSLQDVSIFGEEAYQFQNKVELLPNMPIISPLRDEFIQARDYISMEEREKTLRVVTYNILADLYVSRDVTSSNTTNQNDTIQASHDKKEESTPTPTQFPHVPNFNDLRKTRRLPMIVFELLSYKPDIICLQEVDGGLIYSSFVEPVLNVMGYDGYYSNKASCQREGCFLGWSRDILDVENRELDLQSFNIRDLFELKTYTEDDESSNSVWDSIHGINTLLNDHIELRKVIMEKIGQIAQIATLKLKSQKHKYDVSDEVSKPRNIVVANTHLFYHPLADHIRAIQTYVVCKKIDEIRRQKNNIPSPFLLCGDLNSDPLSGAAQLLFTRTIPEHHDCWSNLHEYKWDCGQSEFMVEHGYIGNEVGVTELKYEEEAFDDAQEQQKEESKPLPPTISLPTSFPNLVSGCLEVPKFTNFAVDFVDTLDYILASEVSENELFGFKQKRSAKMPSHEDINKYIAMPNEFMPSDHVSIVVDLEWDRKL